jgi:hypothetical protein
MRAKSDCIKATKTLGTYSSNPYDMAQPRDVHYLLKRYPDDTSLHKESMFHAHLANPSLFPLSMCQAYFDYYHSWADPETYRTYTSIKDMPTATFFVTENSFPLYLWANSLEDLSSFIDRNIEGEIIQAAHRGTHLFCNAYKITTPERRAAWVPFIRCAQAWNLSRLLKFTGDFEAQYKKEFMAASRIDEAFYQKWNYGQLRACDAMLSGAANLLTSWTDGARVFTAEQLRRDLGNAVLYAERHWAAIRIQSHYKRWRTMLKYRYDPNNRLGRFIVLKMFNTASEPEVL